ncbi:Putative F-box/kelch-repeat protein At1g13200 [Linum grandiflorum]
MMPLPEDIQIEILSRLEIKTLMRFKVGCKSWNSMVKDSSFISKHITLQRKESSTRILIVPKSASSSFNLPNVPSVNLVEISSSGSSHTAKILTQSCQGMFLVGYYNHDNLSTPEDLAIVNPATREKRVLPQYNRFTGPVWSIIRTLYGFGYDSETKDYRVVRLFHLLNAASGGSGEVRAEMYSIRSNSWRQVHLGLVTAETLLHEFLGSRTPEPRYSVYAAGSSHWFMGQKLRIMSFDLHKGILRVDTRLPIRLKKSFSNYHILPRNDGDGSITLLVYYKFYRDRRLRRCLEMREVVPSDQQGGKGWSWDNAKLGMDLESLNDKFDDWSKPFCGDDRILFEFRDDDDWLLHDFSNDSTRVMKGDCIVDDIFIYQERLTTFLDQL